MFLRRARLVELRGVHAHQRELLGELALQPPERRLQVHAVDAAVRPEVEQQQFPREVGEPQGAVRVQPVRIRWEIGRSSPCRSQSSCGELYNQNPMTDYEPVIGLEVHAQLRTGSKMYCACPADYPGRRAQHPRLPGVSRAARHPAGHQPRGHPLHHHDRAGAPLRHSPAQQVRPQELPLPRPDEGVPDIPVRPPALLGRLPRRERGRRAPPRGHRARPHGGGTSRN